MRDISEKIVFEPIYRFKELVYWSYLDEEVRSLLYFALYVPVRGQVLGPRIRVEDYFYVFLQVNWRSMED